MFEEIDDVALAEWCGMTLENGPDLKLMLAMLEAFMKTVVLTTFAHHL